ncbi:hypothetical protein [Pseudoxanthomonas yeongjuensis]|uniref:hypothetical protein n=1 Tax=Pseudoxanthomonas yeongjuensis TaxID=377616 RepID=UPI0013914DB1|nr:hypothetical protein [Pseudoxanthomonas yeongjuensis]
MAAALKHAPRRGRGMENRFTPLGGMGLPSAARSREIIAMTQASFEIAFSAHPVGLKARVEGQGSLENTLAYWQAIVVELEARPAPALLLIDETRGDPLPEQDWQQLVEAMKGKGLDGLRIAHVKPLGLQSVEYCELFALEAGMRARVFSSEDEAITWLRYGLS